MQPTELRIGNLVTDEFYQNIETIIKVESINSKGINLEIADDGNWPELAQNWIEPNYDFESLRGIPLTPEILLKVGAQKVEGTQCYKLAVGDIWIIVYPSGSIEIWNDVDTIKLNIDIDQLHKFQNLVFALTGTELNVDELLK